MLKLFDQALADASISVKGEVSLNMDGEKISFVKTEISESTKAEIGFLTPANDGVLLQRYAEVGGGMAHISIQVSDHADTRTFSRSKEDQKAYGDKICKDLEQSLSNVRVGAHLLIDVLPGQMSIIWDKRSPLGLAYVVKPNFHYGTDGDFRGSLMVVTAIKPPNKSFLYVDRKDMCLYVGTDGRCSKESISSDGHFRSKKK